MNASHVPPGFRFHPTDEELVDYYLRKKLASRRIDLDVIKDVDLYKIEPWDLQEFCRIGAEEQSEWYFFSHKDKKYPTGTRTNRATATGFWKATGRDKPIYTKHSLVGMRKTLVYYQGRAPNGQKSDWIMHEYRLETSENGTPQEEGWVVCRVFKKRVTQTSKGSEHEWFDEHVSFMPDPGSSNLHNLLSHDPFHQLPQLESPNVFNYTSDQRSSLQSSSAIAHGKLHMISVLGGRGNKDQVSDQAVTDWRVLDRFVASQLSHDDNSKEPKYCPDAYDSVQVQEKREDSVEYASASTSSCPIEHWK